MFDDFFLNKGVEALIQNEREKLKTIGKVLQVKEEGLLIDVQMLYRAAGEEPINNVPVIKNKYVNTPINEGDFVLLLTLSHLVENFFINNEVYEKAPIELESYIALPLVTKAGFQHKNEISLKSEGFSVQINKEGTKVESTEKITLKNTENTYLKNLKDLNVEVDQKLLFSGKEACKIDTGEFSVKSSNPITLKTELSNLSTVLENIIEAINLASLSISASPGSPNTSNPALIPLLEKIKADLKLLLR